MMRQIWRALLGLSLLWVAGAPALRGAAPAERRIPKIFGSRKIAAPTPPMGWNSWDSYGLTVNEQQFRANVEVLRDRLKPYGWTYAVIDEGWFFQNPEARPRPQQLLYQLDKYGRYVPVPARFPSAEQPMVQHEVTTADGQSVIDSENKGFIELGKWVHAQGLKFGIHIVRGIPRESVRRNTPVQGSRFKAQEAADQTDACGWDPTNWGVRDNAAGQAWYDALVRQYASWGVDLLKVDCIADHPYKPSEIKQLRHAILKSGRPIVLSISPGPTNLSHAAEVTEMAQMWRISDDIWDVWNVGNDRSFPQPVRSQFARLAAWAQYAKPGNWPDADMLPLGELRPKPDVGPGARTTRLNPVEQRTLLSLWAVARSPLILGSNLTLLDDPTMLLLTNKDLLRINQTATTSREVLHDGDLIAWKADLPGGEQALALFNLGESPMSVNQPVTAFSLTSAGESPQVRLHELWSGRDLAAQGAVTWDLPPHGSVVFMLRR